MHTRSSLTGSSSRSALWLGAAALVICQLCVACSAQWSEQQSFVMSTVLNQRVQGPQEVCAENLSIAQNLENMLSRTIEGSDVSRLRETEGAVAISEYTEDALRAALQAWRDTDGAFDPALGALRDAWDFSGSPRVPDEDELKRLLELPGAGSVEIGALEADSGGADIDLGGLGKGLALDGMWEAMREEDVRNAIISFGGAVLAMGSREDGKEWLVGVRDPFSRDSGAWIAVIGMSDAIIETSGISEQSFTENGKTYHHILDPDTGMPADNGLVSVSVAGQSGTEADIMSTALFVMGPEDGTRYAEDNGIAALFVNSDKEIWTTSWFDYEISDIDPSFTLL